MSTDDRSLQMKSYFSRFKSVIYEPNSAIKMALRSVLADIGVPAKDIYSVNTSSELHQAITDFKPQLLFISDVLDTAQMAMAIKKHQQILPFRFDTAITCMTNYNSMVTASAMAEFGADLIVAKPFTPQQLKDKLVDYFLTRLNPAPEILTLEKARELIHRQRYSECELMLQQICTMVKPTALALCLLGDSLRLQNKLDQARQSYEQSLTLDPLNFFALIHSFDLAFDRKDYASALGFARRLLKNYPINPRRIELFIRLAVVTHAYEDLLFYCSLAEVDSLRSEPNVIRDLAAGLAVGAKYLISQDGESRDLTLIRQCLYQAGRLGSDYPKIIQNVIRSDLEIGELVSAEELLQRNSIALQSEPSWRELQMILFYRQGDYAKALMNGLNLLKERYYNEEVFRISIKSAVRIDRNPEFIKELYQDALRRYPDLANLAPLVSGL